MLMYKAIIKLVMMMAVLAVMGGDNNIPRPIPNTRPQPLPNNLGSSPSSGNNQNWDSICNQIKSILVGSCDQLVDSDGPLTADGQRAHDWIQNGMLLGGSALAIIGGNVGSLPLIIGGLKILSTQTGCDNIVNWDSLDSNQLSLFDTNIPPLIQVIK
jgi:hypothetical protein